MIFKRLFHDFVIFSVNGLKTALQLSDKDWNTLFRLNKPTKKDRNLVFYARGPNTSRTAVEIAHRLGFKGFVFRRFFLIFCHILKIIQILDILISELFHYSVQTLIFTEVFLTIPYIYSIIQINSAK